MGSEVSSINSNSKSLEMEIPGHNFSEGAAADGHCRRKQLQMALAGDFYCPFIWDEGNKSSGESLVIRKALPSKMEGRDELSSIKADGINDSLPEIPAVGRDLNGGDNIRDEELVKLMLSEMVKVVEKADEIIKGDPTSDICIPEKISDSNCSMEMHFKSAAAGNSQVNVVNCCTGSSQPLFVDAASGNSQANFVDSSTGSSEPFVIMVDSGIQTSQGLFERAHEEPDIVSTAHSNSRLLMATPEYPPKRRKVSCDSGKSYSIYSASSASSTVNFEFGENDKENYFSIADTTKMLGRNVSKRKLSSILCELDCEEDESEKENISPLLAIQSKPNKGFVRVGLSRKSRNSFCSPKIQRKIEDESE